MVVVTIATLLLLEIALQTFFYIRNGYWLFGGHNSFSVKYVKPVGDRRQYSLKEGAVVDRDTINSEGFRGPAMNGHDHRPVICILGDSVPFGVGVRGSETFPARLQEDLDHNGYRYFVLNAGVPSYNLRQSLDRWRFDVEPTYKCIIIVLNAANDVSLIDYYGSKWSPDLTWASARFGIKAAQISATVFFAQQAARRVDELRERQPKGADDAVFAVGDGVTHGLASALAQGARVVVMPVNACFYWDTAGGDARDRQACSGYSDYRPLADRWRPLIDKINSMLRQVSQQKGAEYFDTVAAFDKNLGREGMFVDFMHYSERGNKAVADKLFKILMRQGYVTRQESAARTGAAP